MEAVVARSDSGEGPKAAPDASGGHNFGGSGQTVRDADVWLYEHRGVGLMFANPKVKKLYLWESTNSAEERDEVGHAPPFANAEGRVWFISGRTMRGLPKVGSVA